MTATTIKSDNVTNVQAGTTLGKVQGVRKTIIDKDVIPTTSTDEQDDLMLFGPIPSDAVILDVLINTDDLESAGDALAVNVGLFYSGIGTKQKFDDRRTSGDTVDVDAFASAITTLQGAVTTWTSVRFEAAGAVIENMGKAAWELAGLSTDPGGFFWVGLKVTTAGGTETQGDLVVRIDYI